MKGEKSIEEIYEEISQNMEGKRNYIRLRLREDFYTPALANKLKEMEGENWQVVTVEIIPREKKAVEEDSLPVNEDSIPQLFSRYCQEQGLSEEVVKLFTVIIKKQERLVRPLRLEVEKFLGLESLNLDFESSLFVLIGPNGAGKSSILEAIFFALFGRGIRLERGKRELINRGYPEGPLRVSLEFLLGGSEFRVVREYSPRGGVAVLEKKENGVWNSLTSGEQSVNQKIEEILGFDYLTFKSSVFLPQGETLSFVEATPAERFKVLSNLFGLELLDSIQERVKKNYASERELLPGKTGSRAEEKI